MTSAFSFHVSTTPFDEHYAPSANSRITTNFANLARGEHRQRNLRNVLAMINRRCNDLAHWDNEYRDRYEVELDIVSVELRFSHDGEGHAFPLLEFLDLAVVDQQAGRRVSGIAGNNFSSFLRDFDFSVLLPTLTEAPRTERLPDGFGDLHGRLFQQFLDSDAYRNRFSLPPVICISVSTSRTYRRTENHHPVLGVEYRQDDPSLTDAYFAKMGLQVRYFLPPGGVAPLAFYFHGDLLNDYSNLQLIATISTMETFQKIYRPEIYNANSSAAHLYRPSLSHEDFSRTGIDYDRVERSQLAITQGTFAEEHFVKPFAHLFTTEAASLAVPA